MDNPAHQIKRFFLMRDIDESGVSGTGIVAVGCILPSGHAVMEWTTYHSSIAIYKNIQDVELIHSHGGKTKVVIVEEPKEKVKKHGRKKLQDM